MPGVNDIQVLVVDDNRQMRTLMRCLLRAAGVFRVAEAEGAMDAFDLMNRFPIDLVLVDWLMKPVDGVAFARLIRHSAESPNPFVPILMMTAHTEKWRVTEARDAGVNGFLKKPISARVLFERMSAALLDNREFVRAGEYFGPDRRHGDKPGYDGPFRRASDGERDTFDIDDLLRERA